MRTPKRKLQEFIVNRDFIAAIEQADMHGFDLVYLATNPLQPALIVKRFTDQYMGDFAAHITLSEKGYKRPYYSITHVQTGKAFYTNNSQQSATASVRSALRKLDGLSVEARRGARYTYGSITSTPEQRRQQILDASE